MRPPLLLLRPEPGATATAERAALAGWEAVTAPLFTVGPRAWDAPDPAAFDALMLTSANALRFGGGALTAYHHLPVYAVGAATGAAAREAGFATVHQGDRDVGVLLALAAGAGVRRLLHPTGREHRAAQHPALSIERRIVYASDAVAALPLEARAALRRRPIALLHSTRAAKIFAAFVPDRSVVAIAAISPAALAAAGQGWRAATAADRPADDALLAAAARLCE